MTDNESTPKRRRWWLILLGAFIALILLVVGGVFAIGSVLDEKVTSSVTMTFEQSPDIVWAAIVDNESNPVSGAMRRKTVALPNEETGPAWQEDIGSSVITIRTIESSKPSKLTRMFEDSVVPMMSLVEYLLEAENEGTKVTMNSTTHVNDGTWHVPLFRVMLHLAPDAGSLAYLTDLRAHLNANNESDADEIS